MPAQCFAEHRDCTGMPQLTSANYLSSAACFARTLQTLGSETAWM
jgi:hypothetical protein